MQNLTVGWSLYGVLMVTKELVECIQCIAGIVSVKPLTHVASKCAFLLGAQLQGFAISS